MHFRILSSFHIHHFVFASCQLCDLYYEMKLNWRYMSDSPCFATLKRFIMGFVADMVVIIVVIIIIATNDFCIGCILKLVKHLPWHRLCCK